MVADGSPTNPPTSAPLVSRSFEKPRISAGLAPYPEPLDVIPVAPHPPPLARGATYPRPAASLPPRASKRTPTWCARANAIGKPRPSCRPARTRKILTPPSGALTPHPHRLRVPLPVPRTPPRPAQPILAAAPSCEPRTSLAPPPAAPCPCPRSPGAIPALCRPADLRRSSASARRQPSPSHGRNLCRGLDLDAVFEPRCSQALLD